MRANFKTFGVLIFRALAQLIFIEKPAAGALVLIAIGLISPWCATGAVIGSLCGNAFHLLLGTYAQSAWRTGVGGFNCAVIGILWGGFPAAGEPNVTLFAAALAVCIVLEFFAIRGLSRLGLPLLVLPATLTALLLSLALAGSSSWLWLETNAAFGEPGVALAIVCVIVAIGLDSPRNAIPVVLIGGSSALLATTWSSTGVLATAGLWAFTVAPAVLAMQMLCFGPTLRSALAGVVAASIGSTLWILGFESGLVSWAPPLLLPYILGVWAAIAIGRVWAGCVWLNAPFWQALGLLWPRRFAQRTVTVLTGDIAAPHQQPGTSPMHAWTPLLTHTTSGVAEWETHDQARQILSKLQPTRTHFFLAELERLASVNGILTTAQDTCLERAGGINVSHLYGSAEQTVCSGCKRTDRWPPGRLWRLYTLRCAACGALLRPARLSSGMGVEADRAIDCLEQSDVLLMIEPDARSCQSLRLLEVARSRGLRVVVMKGRRTTFSPLPADIVVVGNVETVLALFRRTLRVAKLFDRRKAEHQFSPVSRSSAS